MTFSIMSLLDVEIEESQKIHKMEVLASKVMYFFKCLINGMAKWNKGFWHHYVVKTHDFYM